MRKIYKICADLVAYYNAFHPCCRQKYYLLQPVLLWIHYLMDCQKYIFSRQTTCLQFTPIKGRKIRFRNLSSVDHTLYINLYNTQKTESTTFLMFFITRWPKEPSRKSCWVILGNWESVYMYLYPGNRKDNFIYWEMGNELLLRIGK